MPDAEVVRRDLPSEELRARLAADACVVLPGEFINMAEFQPEEIAGCNFQNESGFYFLTDEPPPEAPAPPKKAKPMSTTTPTIEVIADAVPASADLLSQIPLSIPDAGISLPINQPIAAMAAPADLKSVLPAAADANGFTVIMAVVAVAGGGAAWKFYNDHSKRKHEQEMARIERSDNDDSHKKCDASRAALELRVTEVQAKIEGLNARLDAIHQSIADLKNTPPKLSFDADDLEERLAKLEKKAKKERKQS